MLEYNISEIKMFPKGKGVIPLRGNKIYKGLLEIKNNLEIARNEMEPYFQENRSFFRSVTSNFGSFKGARFHISWRFNTPSVDNLWIVIYEILSHFHLVPEKLDDEQKEWIHFSSENLPGSTILATHHYINTMRDSDFIFKNGWFGSFPENGRKYKSEDIYNLFQNYPNNWCPLEVPFKKRETQVPLGKGRISTLSNSQTCRRQDLPKKESTKSVKLGNPISTSEKKDVTDPLYSYHVRHYLENKISESHKVNLFIGNITLELDGDYNSEEEKHNKVFLGQIFLCFNILKKGGNAILRNLTFFTKFNISMLAWTKKYFDKLIICKPVSSKDDSSETFLICKGFRGIHENSMKDIELILNNKGYDFKNSEIMRIDKIQIQFWRDIGRASAIFIKQIKNIRYNINNFNGLNYDYSSNQSKILRASQQRFHKKAEEDIIKWNSTYVLKPLSQKRWLNIVNTTKKKYNRKRA